MKHLRLTLALAWASAAAGCGYTEQEWQAQLARYEKLQSQNKALEATVAEMRQALEAREAAPVQRPPLPVATQPAPPPPPPPTVDAPPPPPPPTDRDDGIKLSKLRARIKAGAKPEAAIEIAVKTLGPDAKLSVEAVDGPCTFELEGNKVQASAAEPGTCKGRVTALNSAGTQRTVKEFGVEVDKATKKGSAPR